MVFIVDCHSFNDLSLPWEPEAKRCDICIGFDNKYTPLQVLCDLITHFNNNNLSVSINDPYCGTIVPSLINNPHTVKSIMIEVNKKLYLDDKYKVTRNFSKIEKILQQALYIIYDWTENEQI